MNKLTPLLMCSLTFLAACSTDNSNNDTAVIADTVLSDGYIYTVNQQQAIANSIAIKDDKVIYVGDNAGAQDLIGEGTQVVDLAGKMVLPGLHDSHVHPLGIVQPDICDLKSQPLSLDEITVFLQDCIAHYNIAEGEWLAVPQWNFSVGNQPSRETPNIRIALDKASSKHLILLQGNDGHHAAANSLALANVSDKSGNKVGLSKATLADQFSDYKTLVAVDERGEPSGGLTETAMALTEAPGFLGGIDFDDIMPEIATTFAQSGITSILDAATDPSHLAHYIALEKSGKMTFRMRAALIRGFGGSDSEPATLNNIPEVIKEFKSLREHVANNSQLIRADAAKIFIDGVIEGDPLAQPPTLPNAAALNNYHQPMFNIDLDNHKVDITGYVNPNSEACQTLAKGKPLSDIAVDQFTQANGHHPGQCKVSNGVLEHEFAFIEQYMTALNDAGMTIHAHAIGDRAVRTAVDIFESFQQAGKPKLSHSIGHAQLVHPDDQKRMGEMGMYVTFTHAWAITDVPYDLSVTPFIEKVSGVNDLYNPETYYNKNVYPVKALLELGAIIVSGSDAPVEDRDPRPFWNIEKAVIRKNDDAPALAPHQRLSIHQAIASYTINGAKVLDQSDLTGSIEVGKKADLIVLDQNIVSLAENNLAHKIKDTKVLATYFNGKRVYSAQP